MKHILLTLLLVNSILAYSQFVKGDKYLSGAINFNSQRAPNSPNGGLTNLVNSFSIYPSVGFLLKEKFAIGGQIGYSSYFSKSTNAGTIIFESKSTSIAAGIFARRYFRISEKFLFSITGLVDFRRGSNKNTTTNTSTNAESEVKNQFYRLSASLRPNFVFFPSPKWGFEASVGNISHSFNRSLSIDEKSNLFNFNYGAITLGLSYYFRKEN